MDEQKEGLATYSAKVDPEIKLTLQSKIGESGKTAGEFISSLLATYETAQNRESLSDIHELNQLKNFLARIEEVYVSMAKSRKDLEEGNAVTVTTLQDEVKSLKAEIHDVKEFTKLEIEEAQKRADESDKQREIALSEFDKLRDSKDRAEKSADAMTSILEQQKSLIVELRDTAQKATISADKSNVSHQIIWEENQKLKIQLRDITAQVKVNIATAINDTLKESAKEMKSLHDKIEALQNDKLKLTEALSVEREKVIKLEFAPNESKEKMIRTESREPKQKGSLEKAPRTEPRDLK